MNYFEIFNKVLLELNYRQVLNFENIYKSEHKKILDAINRVNSEVLISHEWPFLERCTFLDTVKDENLYKLPFKGNIKAVYSNGERVLYTSNAQELLEGRLHGNFYSVIRDSIVFEKACKERNYRILYESRNFALSEDGKFKEKLEGKGDISLIPMPFAEHILVYGTCLKVKANPAYPKFGFWNTMYIGALANLLQKSPQTNECGPIIKLT